jgi:hypothetical protein
MLGTRDVSDPHGPFVTFFNSGVALRATLTKVSAQNETRMSLKACLRVPKIMAHVACHRLRGEGILPFSLSSAYPQVKLVDGLCDSLAGHAPRILLLYQFSSVAG